MSFNVAMLKAMQAEGLSLEACIRVLEAGEKRADPTAAERMRNYRARKQGRVTRNVTPEPPNDITLTPGSDDKSSSPVSTRKQAWPCPEGVEPQHWADFLKNRKRKRCVETQTALDGILADIAKIADADWPPGRLVQHAAAKGWASIHDPRKGFQNDRQQQQQHRPASRNTEAFALAMHGLDPSAPM